MKTLVIIPSLQHKYTFSAPLAWLFGNHVEYVDGTYSFSLDKDLVKKYDQFIVELNWFIELYEFQLITKFIKKHNPNSSILFGGQYSQLKYKEIFEHAPVDYFIRGDAEVPIQHFVEGEDPRKIPNMIGRDFENPQSYIFQQEDYPNLEFNLDWFPDFEKRWPDFPAPGADVEPDFSMMPLLPKYWERPGRKLPPRLQWRVPPRGGRYHLPMLITARGSCPVSHDGCEYCMGSKTELGRSIYKRPPVILDNETCILLLKKIEKKFEQVSIYINTPFSYDFSHERFDLDATIEIDSKSTAEDASKILHAFRSTRLHTALYEEGLVGSEIRKNIEKYDTIEDESHKVYFFASPEDAANHQIPPHRRLYSELLFPAWAHWSFYNDRKNALARSRSWYFVTGQSNLYPVPRQILMRVFQFLFVRIAFILHHFKIIDLKKKLIF
jgi:hypothetical protein